MRRRLPGRRRLLLALSAGTAALTMVLGLPSPARAAVVPAEQGNFSGVFAAARGGDVIELAPGDYGRFTGGAKPATVTIRPRAGADVTMSVEFSSAVNVRIEGVTMREAYISGSSRNVTIAGSRFTGSALVNADSMVNANIVFDGDTFAGIDVCDDCYEGRLTVVRRGPGPSGVRIQNSVFGPGGNADGIQIGADGVQVLGNEFVGIKQISEVHTDALQLYGQRRTTVRGNYFHDVDVVIMAPDGGNHEVIADNVFIGGRYRPAIQLGSHVGTSFVHNTLKGIDVFMDKKSERPDPSSGGEVRDNILINGSIHAGGSTCTGCQVSHNLFSRGRGSGSNAVIGTPVFVGGSNPLTYTGFLLAASSPGKGNASDGTDRGARIARLKVRRRVRWARLRRGLRARVTVREGAKLRFRLRRKADGRSLARMSRTVRHAATRTYVVRPRRERLGRRRAMTVVLRVTVIHDAGWKTTLRTTIRVRR